MRVTSRSPPLERDWGDDARQRNRRPRQCTHGDDGGGGQHGAGEQWSGAPGRPAPRQQRRDRPREEQGAHSQDRGGGPATHGSPGRVDAAANHAPLEQGLPGRVREDECVRRDRLAGALVPRSEGNGHERGVPRERVGRKAAVGADRRERGLRHDRADAAAGFDDGLHPREARAGRSRCDEQRGIAGEPRARQVGGPTRPRQGHGIGSVDRDGHLALAGAGEAGKQVSGRAEVRAGRHNERRAIRDRGRRVLQLQRQGSELASHLVGDAPRGILLGPTEVPVLVRQPGGRRGEDGGQKGQKHPPRPEANRHAHG